MDTAETAVTFNDCVDEVRRVCTIRFAACREAVAANGLNRMTSQAAHVQLAKLRGALEILEELRNGDGVAARIARRTRTVKTTP